MEIDIQQKIKIFSCFSRNLKINIIVLKNKIAILESRDLYFIHFFL
uniref:Uncharacterized protein n=1 Tax=Strigamia maritima TaxID=126957 RepID=T1II94_STRMM